MRGDRVVGGSIKRRTPPVPPFRPPPLIACAPPPCACPTRGCFSCCAWVKIFSAMLCGCAPNPNAGLEVHAHPQTLWWLRRDSSAAIPGFVSAYVVRLYFGYMSLLTVL